MDDALWKRNKVLCAVTKCCSPLAATVSFDFLGVTDSMYEKPVREALNPISISIADEREVDILEDLCVYNNTVSTKCPYNLEHSL